MHVDLTDAELQERFQEMAWPTPGSQERLRQRHRKDGMQAALRFPKDKKATKKFWSETMHLGRCQTIQSDDLILKHTIAEGCMTAHEPGQFNINAPGHHTQQVEGNTIYGNAILYCLQ